jgi:molybdopterin synthase sulfur carrier subunit
LSVTVRLPTAMRAHAGGQSEVKAEGSTIGAVVEDLIRQFPGLAANLRNAEGGLHRFVNLYVNDEDIRYHGGLDATIDDGDQVSILPAVAGGS